ncbi:hypothetical protein ES708_08893 [subsurface metagenome]
MAISSPNYPDPHQRFLWTVEKISKTKPNILLYNSSNSEIECLFEKYGTYLITLNISLDYNSSISHIYQEYIVWKYSGIFSNPYFYILISSGIYGISFIIMKKKEENKLNPQKTLMYDWGNT